MVKKLLFLSICLALCSAYVWAGDPADANNPDTVYMDNVPYVRALQSNIAVSVNFFNDEELIGVEIPLIWHNPNNLGIYLDSISYVDSRVAEFGLKSSVNSPLEIDNVNHKVILWCLPTGFDGEPPTIVPGTGLFATLYFHTDDTWDKYAPVTIDTFSNANHALMFTINQMWPIVSFTPIFKGGIVTEVHEVPSAEVPKGFALYQNYPNPFNPETAIRFGVREGGGHVTLTVYNILGQQVKKLADGFYAGGVHEVTWNGTDENGQSVSSGTYFYLFKTDSSAETKKMNLVK